MKPRLKTNKSNPLILPDHLNLGDEEPVGDKKWYSELDEDPKSFATCTEQTLIELKDEAKRCHDAEVAHYNIKSSKTNKDYQWIKTVMSKGTISDKIASYVVAIQDEPLCSLEILRNMVNMVKVGKKKECTLVVDTLTELFLSDILKPNRKLKPFYERPLSLVNELSSGNAISRRKLLSLWYFEDQLKEIYHSYVLALNNIAHDTIDKNKEQAVGAMYKLLCGNPEQEKNLLSHLVNKLGDPSQKVASKTIYCLSQLLFKHPNMQRVVLNDVERLLFRPNVSSKAQYYGLCFLSQYYLSHDSREVAQALIEVYFSFFKACIKKGEVDSRMMSALLMGVNRAYPYARMAEGKIAGHIDTIYRVVHMANFNIGLHALTLLYQVADFGNSVSDRFFSALYRKLFDPDLLTTTHQAMLLSLVYKALLKDNELARVKVFVKRLLQLALYMQTSFACGVLYLVSQLIGKRVGLQSIVLKQSKLNNQDNGEDEDEEEHYKDVKEESDVKSEDVKPELDEQMTATAGASWHHRDISANKTKKVARDQYQAFARNPLYAGGEVCAFTELKLLKDHFHPTVSLYATTILQGEIIRYSGDPLKDFTLIRFLDRFVFKNPKKTEVHDVKGAHPTFGIRKLYRAKGLRSLPVTNPNYLNENVANIPVDELFMYRYLQQKNEERKQKESDDDSDLESVQSEEFEEMLDKMSGLPKDDEDLDFMHDITDSMKNKDKSKSKRKRGDDEDEDEESDDEIEDEESDLEDDMDMNDSDEDLFDDLDDDEDEDLVFDSEDDLKSGQTASKKSKKTKGAKNKIDLDDDEDLLFDSDDDLDFDESSKSSKKLKKITVGKSKDDANLFASAEEFASLLEDEGSAKIAPGGSNAFSNKDNANLKQLAWEDKRNRWLHGYDRAMGKRKKAGSSSFQKRPGGKSAVLRKKSKK